MKNLKEQTQKVQNIINKTGAEFYYVSFDEEEIHLQAELGQADKLSQLMFDGWECTKSETGFIIKKDDTIIILNKNYWHPVKL